MKHFFAAIADNNAALFHSLLDKYPDLANSRSEQGVSAVLYAVYYGRREFASEMVLMGAKVGVFEAAALGDLERIKTIVRSDPASVNAFSPDGFQPLGLAAYFGQAKVARYLLDHGADPNSHSRNHQMVAPLHSAASSNSVDVAAALIEKGADINAKQQGGYSPLHSAVMSGSAEMVGLLLRRGADCGSRNDIGQSPKDLANRKNARDIDILLRACID